MTPEFAALDFSALRVTIGGGAAVQSEVARRWRDITGSELVEGYGLTEASPVVCINPFFEPKLGTVGLPVPSTEVTIRDDAGEVACRSARTARSGCAARRSCSAIGGGRTRRRMCSPPTAGCKPAISARSTRRAF